MPASAAGINSGRRAGGPDVLESNRPPPSNAPARCPALPSQGPSLGPGQGQGFATGHGQHHHGPSTQKSIAEKTTKKPRRTQREIRNNRVTSVSKNSRFRIVLHTPVSYKRPPFSRLSKTIPTDVTDFLKFFIKSHYGPGSPCSLRLRRIPMRMENKQRQVGTPQSLIAL